MSTKPKGRPPIEPRLRALEDLAESLAGIIKFNEERILQLEQHTQIMQEAFNCGRLPRPMTYMSVQ
jgi:hypothetical protein